MSYVLDKEWSEKLSKAVDVEFKKKLFSFINEEYATKTVFPPKEKIFNSLNYVPLDKIKVVIIIVIIVFSYIPIKSNKRS